MYRQWAFVWAALLLFAPAACRQGPSSKPVWQWINWDVQTPVIESREAWDAATDRKNDYQGTSNMLAR